MPERLTNKRIVAFGGTGKTVALIYMKLCRIMGFRPDIVIVDFPPGTDQNATDGQLDNDLAAEAASWPDSFRRINTMPDDRPLEPVPLVATFNFDPEVADALFTHEQQETPPTRGLNAEPQVGACVAHLKLNLDGHKVRDSILGGPSEIFLVAGLGGGTGAGVTLPFAEYVRTDQIQLHGVFLLPWRNIGEVGTVTNANQRRNAASVLSYLKDRAGRYFSDYTVIGPLPAMQMYEGAVENSAHANYPTLILAALYLLLCDAWGGGAHLTMQQRRIETVDAGISLREIQTAFEGKNLYDMLVLAVRKSWVLRDLAHEDPDEAMATLSFAPLSNALGCQPLSWLTKTYTRKMNYATFAVGWTNLREDLENAARRTSESLDWIVRLAGDARLFNFDRDELYRNAKADYADYLGTIRGSKYHREFRLKETAPAEAREATSRFILQDIVHRILMQEPRRA